MIEAGSPFAAPVKTIRTPGFLHLLRVLRATHMVVIAGIRLKAELQTPSRKQRKIFRLAPGGVLPYL
jgi:hypothetical protein